MRIFIRAASCISPQQTFNHQLFSTGAVEYNATALKVIEPDYKNSFDAKQIRRMSRIVRIGLAAARQCVSEASMQNVDAIITGTAYGCMDDSEKFLKTIVEQNEAMLSPSSFIQSTHNTVAAQIALLLKCHNYNNTFVHRGFSFEHALMDAMLLLKEKSADNVLTGSADEMTEFTFSIFERFGLFKHDAVNNLKLFESVSKGSISGEGAAFFLLSNEANPENYAEISGLQTFYQPDNFTGIENNIERFLSNHTTDVIDINLVVLGKNGDVRTDKNYDLLQSGILKDNACINYKHLCGEYPTSTSFALWLAANIIKRNALPAGVSATKPVDGFKKILLYNNYPNNYHSLMLLSAIN